MEHAQPVCRFGGVFQAPAEQRDFASVLLGYVEDLLYAVNGGAETRDHDALICRAENLVKT